MAYFSNGTEGMILDEQCAVCIHEDQDAGCPIALVQMLYNYDQIGNDDLQAAMNILINEKGRCQMKPLIDKLRKPRPMDTQLEMFG